jgi:hypothetical protein
MTEPEPASDPGERLADRITYLIISDPKLKTAETVGILVMLAIELTIKALKMEP